MMNTKDIEEFANEYNVDADALKSFTAWFLRRVQENAKLSDRFVSSPVSTLQAAIKIWLKQSNEFHAMLLDENSEEGKELRVQIMSGLYEKINDNNS